MMNIAGLIKTSFVESGIPYTTIINFYKNGTDNTKLSTLLRLAKYFHVTLDYIADDDVEDRVS